MNARRGEALLTELLGKPVWCHLSPLVYELHDILALLRQIWDITFILFIFFCLGHLMGSQKMSTAWKNKNMNKWKGRIPTPKSIVKFLHFFNVYWLSEVYLNDIVCGGGMKSTIKLLNTLQIFAFKIIVLSWNKSIQFST